MAVKHTAPKWNRRIFLKGAGLGMLATSGLTALSPLRTQSWAAGERTRFVSTWNAPDILDPHVKYDVGAAAFNLNLYDNLLRYQGNPPEIVPWLAETHEVADGGRKWTFHLRRDARFHDGSALTAEAVYFSFARLLTLGKAPAAIFKRMGLTPEKIRVLDAHTIEFQLAQPYTRALLAAVPKAEIGPWQGTLLQDEPPRPDAISSGCRFRLCCPYVQDDPCAQREPTLQEVAQGHMVACHFASRTCDLVSGRAA